MDDWEKPKQEAISVQAMKEMIINMRKAREKYEEAKKISNTLHDDYKKREDQIVAALQAQGLKKFNVPDLGTSSIKVSYAVTVPKDVGNKRLLFDYIEKHYGQDVLDEYRSINYQSLNAFYKKEAEVAEADGKEFVLPGVEAPTSTFTLQWRSDKK